MSKILSAILVFGFCFGVGFYGGRLSNVGLNPPGRTTPSETAKKRLSEHLHLTQTAPQSVARTPAMSASLGFDALVQTRGLLEKSRHMARAFPSSEAGRRWAQVTTFLQLGPAVETPEGSLVAEQIQWLKRHPESAFAALKSGLRKLEQDYASERQFLIQFATQLDLREQIQFSFLARELRGSGDHADGFDGPAALSALIKVSPDSNEVEASLKRALLAHSNARWRSTLLSYYSAHEPERAKRLFQELASQSGD